MAQIKDQFIKRNVSIIGLSIDSVESHKRFIEDINNINATKDGNFKVDYPMIADENGDISKLVIIYYIKYYSFNTSSILLR